jgi:hypothetical protein
MNITHTPQKPITTRRFSAIDIENLALQPAVSPGAGRHIAYLLQDIFHLKPEDLAVVAGGPHNAFAIDAASKVLSGQSIWRAGHNGADIALIEELDRNLIAYQTGKRSDYRLW